MKRPFNLVGRLLVFWLIIGLNWTGLFAIGRTLAYYNDFETTSLNFWSGGILAVTLRTDADFAPEVLPDTNATRIINLFNYGNLASQYDFNLNNISGDIDLCQQLNLAVSLNGDNIYSGRLEDFNIPTLILATTTIDILDFTASLISAEPGLWHKTCNFTLDFSGWQTNFTNANQGFSDLKTISNTINSGSWGVALNEFLPNPNGFDYGFDFGQDNDQMPRGEWVELYNNGDANVNLSGWYLKDLANHQIFITAANTNLATTTIAAHHWLVVYLNQAILNNSGAETVTLFDDSNNVIDLYNYNGGDYCDLEPTPGEENEDEPIGNCSSVAGNKSFARIPDGAGDWFDPWPTPGRPNILEENVIDLVEISPLEIITEENNPAEFNNETNEISENIEEVISTPDSNNETTINPETNNNQPAETGEATELEELESIELELKTLNEPVIEPVPIEVVKPELVIEPEPVIKPEPNPDPELEPIGDSQPNQDS